MFLNTLFLNTSTSFRSILGYTTCAFVPNSIRPGRVTPRPSQHFHLNSFLFPHSLVSRPALRSPYAVAGTTHNSSRTQFPAVILLSRDTLAAITRTATSNPAGQYIPHDSPAVPTRLNVSISLTSRPPESRPAAHISSYLNENSNDSVFTRFPSVFPPRPSSPSDTFAFSSTENRVVSKVVEASRIRLRRTRIRYPRKRIPTRRPTLGAPDSFPPWNPPSRRTRVFRTRSRYETYRVRTFTNPFLYATIQISTRLPLSETWFSGGHSGKYTVSPSFPRMPKTKQSFPVVRGKFSILQKAKSSVGRVHGNCNFFLSISFIFYFVRTVRPKKKKTQPY